MIIFLIFSILITLSYIVIIHFTIKGWNATPVWKTPKDFQEKKKVSIIVPARNEEENIANTIHHLLAQQYDPEFIEIIIIDDHSEDRTVEIIKSFDKKNIVLIPLAEHVDKDKIQSFKKAAIETAMKFASGEIIIQTDADCVMNEYWLSTLVSYFENHDVKMITAPVSFYQENSLLEKFQSLDFLGMMAVTSAGIHYQFMRMCNGANMAYTKDIFNEVNGFSGNENLASGDDMFLMHKIAEKHPDKIGFVKSNEALVFTKAKPTLKSFYQQRLRWATKNASYDDIRVLFVNAIVFFTCFAFFTAIIFLPFSFYYLGISILVILFGKGIADYIFLSKVAHFFNRKDLMKTFISSQLMHTTYIFTIGMAANFIKNYEWKGRKVK